MPGDKVELAVEGGAGQIRDRVEIAEGIAGQRLRCVDHAIATIWGGFGIRPLGGRKLPVGVDRINDVLGQGHTRDKLDGVDIGSEGELDLPIGAAVILDRDGTVRQIGELDGVIRANRINGDRSAAPGGTRAAGIGGGRMDDPSAIVGRRVRGRKTGVHGDVTIDERDQITAGGDAVANVEDQSLAAQCPGGAQGAVAVVAEADRNGNRCVRRLIFQDGVIEIFGGVVQVETRKHHVVVRTAGP